MFLLNLTGFLSMRFQQRKCQKQSPICVVNGELRRLKKLKRKAYFKFLKKSDVFFKTEYDKIKNHYERVIKTKKKILQTAAGKVSNRRKKFVKYYKQNCRKKLL